MTSRLLGSVHPGARGHLSWMPSVPTVERERRFVSQEVTERLKLSALFRNSRAATG